MRVHSLLHALTLALAAGAAAPAPAAWAEESGWAALNGAQPLLVADSRSRPRDPRPAPSGQSAEEDKRQPLPYGSGYEARKRKESDRNSGSESRDDRSQSDRRRR